MAEIDQNQMDQVVAAILTRHLPVETDSDKLVVTYYRRMLYQLRNGGIDADVDAEQLRTGRK